jgi:hypothetical protein
MSYLDRSFCTSSVTRCKNEKCYRYFGPKQEAGAKRWWGGENPRVAFGDFEPGCTDFEPTDEATARANTTTKGEP